MRFEEAGLSATKLYEEILPMGYKGPIGTIKTFLKTLSKPKIGNEDNQEENNTSFKFQILKKDMYCHLWMHSILQGKIRCEDLEKQLPIDKMTICKLYYWVLNKPLKYRNRAMVILAHFNNFPQSAITRLLCIQHTRVREYINQFDSGGVDALFDRSRKELKKFEQPKYKEAVFKVLHVPPSVYGINRTTWRMKDICRILKQEGFPICKPYIRQITKDAGYRYLKAKRVLTSTDPEYREKLQEITSILSNLKSNEKFFSIDEYGPFAIKMQGGKSLVAPGEEKTIPQWQKSKGSLIMTGALELSSNQMTHFYSEKKDTEEMIKLLEILLEEYKNEKRIYLSWDAASWHASKDLYENVEKVNSSEYRKNHNSPIVELAPLPSCAQFLNVIESVFSGMSKAIIHNSDYASVEECKKAIDLYFAERNHHFKENPKRAGNKIWGKEITPAEFSESNNCKDPRYR